MKERPIDLERAVIAHNQAPVIPQPADGTLDDPAAPIPPQRATILRGRTNAILLVRADQFDSALSQPLAQRIAVVGFVGNHAHRLLPRSAGTVTPTYADRRERRLREADFRRGMQSEGGLPEEHPRRRPPPSTSSPCPAWFFRPRSPFFGGSKTPVQKRFAPVQLLAFVQLAQKRAPDVQPDALLVPVPQPPPARGRMGILFRQVLPPSAAAQNPQNPFQHTTALDPRATALAVFGRFREQGRDFLPLRFGQQRTGPRHRPSLGAAGLGYPSFPKTQPLSFQKLVSGCATASKEIHDDRPSWMLFYSCGE